MTEQVVVASGKSKEEVALTLTHRLLQPTDWNFENKKKVLDLYKECLQASSGHRQE